MKSPTHQPLDRLIPVTLKWGISLSALIMYLRESKLIDEHRAAMLQRQLYTRINTETGRTWERPNPGGTPGCPSSASTPRHRSSPAAVDALAHGYNHKRSATGSSVE